MNAPATDHPRSDHPCSAVRALASRYLDGRLSAASRARVHAHLKECGSCLETYRSLQRLSTMARALPRAAAPADLARRVRKTVSERRQETLARLDLEEAPADSMRAHALAFARVRLRTVVAAAAVVAAVAGALFAGYKLGRLEERADSEGLIASLLSERDRVVDELIDANGGVRRTPEQREELAHSDPRSEAPRLVEIDPGIWQPYRERGFRPEQFVRSARSLWSDLASFQEIEPLFRRPLLSAQLACFELPAQARIYEELANAGVKPAVEFEAVARFIQTVERALASGDGVLDSVVELPSADPFAAIPAAYLDAVPPASERGFEKRIEESVRLACGEAQKDSGLTRAVGRALELKTMFVNGELRSEPQAQIVFYMYTESRWSKHTSKFRVTPDGKKELIGEEIKTESSSTMRSGGDGKRENDEN